jgi:hypothetical protein
VWDRYLTIEGKKAFHIGNVCGTCSFFFERMEGANQRVDASEVIERLNSGLTSLEPSVVGVLESLLPDGRYRVLLQEVRPKLVSPGEEGDYFVEEQVALWGVDRFWSMPHSPKTEYYRLATRVLPGARGLFEFLVPAFPNSWLRTQRLLEYFALLGKRGKPTAVAISVLDVKAPDEWTGVQEVTSHWCLAHYLLDGHHKVYAAALADRPLTLVSFLSAEQGISSPGQVDELLEILSEG